MNRPVPATDADYSIGPLLQLAGRRASDAFAAALVPLEIEGRHFGVLLQLERHGPVNQRRLGALTGSDKSTMVRTIDDLQHRGLVERRSVEGDRRSHAIVLTAAGHEVFVAAEQVAIRTNTELLKHLELAERVELRRLLRTFVNPHPS